MVFDYLNLKKKMRKSTLKEVNLKTIPLKRICVLRTIEINPFIVP
jgi:hypothetical protein